MGDMEKEEDATFISAQSGGDTSGVKPRGWRPFWVRCGSEPEYKQQFLDTLCVWASFFVFGFVYGQPGPTLPDLRIITGTDLDTASWLFTSFSFGYMFGCLISGIIERKINPRLHLFISVFGTAIFTTITPWCKLFELMLVCRTVMGFFVGGIDTGGHTFLFSIWKTEVHTYVQIMYFLFASGGLLVPLLTTPFLWQPPRGMGLLMENMTDIWNSSNYNLTSVNNSDCLNCTATQMILPTTNVHYSFLISGIICTLASIPFLIRFILKGNHRYPEENRDQEEGKVQTKHKIKFIVAVVLLTLLFGIITGWIDSFAGFLMSFSTRHLSWTKPEGSLATTMFWVAYAIGNFMCIFLVQCFRTGTLLFCYFILSIIGTAVLIAASIHIASAPVWVAIIITGFSMSIMWPGVFTWTEETVTPVNGKIASLFLVAGAVGFMVNPPAVGYTMDNITDIGYGYWHFGEAVFLLGIFVTVAIMYWNEGVNRDKTEKPKDVELKLMRNSENKPLNTD